MLERVSKAIESGRLHDRHCGAHVLEDLLNAFDAFAFDLAMDAQVEQCELELAHACHSRMIGARAEEAFQFFLGQRFAGFDMRRDQRQHFRLPRKVFHELTRQLDGVPCDAVDAGDARVVHACEHVMQPVAELVEHGDHFRVREQRRLVANRRSEVADEIGDRQAAGSAEVFASDTFVHPCAAALLRSCVQVDEEASAPGAVGIQDVIELNVGMVSIEALALDDAYAVQALCDDEHAAQHARQRKVRTQRFFGERETFALQTLGVEGDIPCVERTSGEFGELVELATRDGFALRRELLQKLAYLADG